MIPANKRSAIRILLGVGVAVISAGVGVGVQSTRLGSWVEQRTYDLRFVLRGPLPHSSDAPITIVAVDDQALAEIPEPIMLWHWHFANALDALAEAGAAAIGVDFLFSDITRFDPEGQQAFSQALLKAGAAEVPVVLAYRVNPSGIEEPPEFLKLAAAAGHEFAYVNLTTDTDDFVRRQQVVSLSAENEILPGFAFALAKAFATKTHKVLEPPSADRQTILINFAGPAHYDSISFKEVLAAARSGNYESLKSRVGGRIVLIGPYQLSGNEDVHPTPYYYSVDRRYSLQSARTPGIEIHANTIATLLRGNSIVRLSPSSQFLATLGLAALATFLCFRFHPVTALVLALASVASYAILALGAFHEGLWLFVVSPAVAVFVAAALSETSNYVLEGREKRRLRRLFKSYVHDQVIEKILEVSARFVLAGEKKRITVLFADIRSFTTRSESMDAQALVADLNQYFKAMIGAIHKHNGMIDKFMGDGIMALFGAPLDDPDAALHAVEAAQEMLMALATLNEQIAAKGGESIRIGIGIHTGEVVIGNIGSPERMEYTAIGDVVNTASRIEGLTRRLDADIIITADTFNELQGRIPATCLGEQPVRGKNLPVTVYRVS